jgi:hypothetical protein
MSRTTASKVIHPKAGGWQGTYFVSTGCCAGRDLLTKMIIIENIYVDTIPFTRKLPPSR